MRGTHTSRDCENEHPKVEKREEKNCCFDVG